MPAAQSFSASSLAPNVAAGLLYGALSPKGDSLLLANVTLPGTPVVVLEDDGGAVVTCGEETVGATFTSADAFQTARGSWTSGVVLVASCEGQRTLFK